MEENYIPYDLLLKGKENCTILEKIIWNFCEFKYKLNNFLKGILYGKY